MNNIDVIIAKPRYGSYSNEHDSWFEKCEDVLGLYLANPGKPDWFCMHNHPSDYRLSWSRIVVSLLMITVGTYVISHDAAMLVSISIDMLFHWVPTDPGIFMNYVSKPLAGVLVAILGLILIGIWGLNISNHLFVLICDVLSRVLSKQMTMNHAMYKLSGSE